MDSFLKEISLGTKGLEETGGSSGHCWVTYLSEKNEWLILDWCYNYKTRGQLWRNAEDYFKIWFSFNQKLLFAADMLDR